MSLHRTNWRKIQRDFTPRQGVENYQSVSSKESSSPPPSSSSLPAQLTLIVCPLYLEYIFPSSVSAIPSAVPDRLVFLNDRLSLREASSYFGELFVLKYEAKGTRGGSGEVGGVVDWKVRRRWREEGRGWGSGWFTAPLLSQKTRSLFVWKHPFVTGKREFVLLFTHLVEIMPSEFSFWTTSSPGVVTWLLVWDNL